MKKIPMLCVLVATALLSLGACKKKTDTTEGPMESAGAEVDKKAEKAGDAAEEAADDASEDIDEAGDETAEKTK